MDDETRFRAAIGSLLGQECWGAAAGKGTGSMVTTSFGKKIPRVVPVKNPCLSALVRDNEGQYTLFLKWAAWRIHEHRGVICGSTSSNHPGEAMLNGLTTLFEKRVTKIALSEIAFDLLLEFEAGIVLQVFCDQTNDVDGDNYSFCNREDWFVVGRASKLTISPADTRTIN